MVLNDKTPKRLRGRPQIRPDAETRQLIVAAARHEFHGRGYAGASMGRVAERAGVSTKTMYRLIPTKADLFRSVVADRISRFYLELDEKRLEELPIEEALERILIGYGTLSFDEEAVSSLHLVIAECDRFPEIGTAFYELALRPTSQTMAAWLERRQKLGEIEAGDAMVAVGVLRGMMTMEPQRAIMLGLRPPPDLEEITIRARYCARLFLSGCRTKQG
ncbi:TetR family transcriptional regulator [Labrys okinawensis]|uniref:TetR family transcriptional regulator n=1 Tax=Labrys okinawensis TaxID=346911 RepID=A0A2S9QI82_9HYPH|nr:TetR/AcrR family transcriptional regulator [Labrys okinawensis]PRH89032.1 TetR family transcriptional regulator [Labrys okinawensis]